jgi:membrane protein DedA with SNARE-associated domain
MELMAVLAQHAYAVVAVVLFLAAAGLPLPTSIVLLTAGALAHDPQSGVALPIIYLLACAAAISGDILLFFGGRYTGWWLLAGMCRLSMNPGYGNDSGENGPYCGGQNSYNLATTYAVP